MTKFSNNPRNPLFWGHFGPFLLKFGQKWIFLEKKGSLNIPIIYHRAKNQKKLLNHFWQKRRTDGRTDRQTDRQWWFYRTLRMTGTQKETWKVFFGCQSLGAKTAVSQTAWILHWQHTVYVISSVSRKIFEAFKIKIASCQTLPRPQ